MSTHKDDTGFEVIDCSDNYVMLDLDIKRMCDTEDILAKLEKLKLLGYRPVSLGPNGGVLCEVPLP